MYNSVCIILINIFQMHNSYQVILEMCNFYQVISWISKLNKQFQQMTHLYLIKKSFKIKEKITYCCGLCASCGTLQSCRRNPQTSFQLIFIQNLFLLKNDDSFSNWLQIWHYLATQTHTHTHVHTYTPTHAHTNLLKRGCTTYHTICDEW